MGYEDVSSKSQLSQEDVHFARIIQRIQRVFVSELNKIAVIHLYSMGYKDSDLLNFEIRMANPSTISELQFLELWRTKFEVASVIQEGMFDKNFIYKRIWKLSDYEIEQIEEGRRKDRLMDLEIENIQSAEAALPPEPEATPGLPEPEAPTPEEPTTPSAEPGLPPPPGAPEPITAVYDPMLDGRDPNRQIAAPNDLLKVQTKTKKKRLFPDLKNYAFNTKKTAMDPKRTKSELERGIRNPFGESFNDDLKEILGMNEDDYVQEKHFKKDIDQLNKFISKLDEIEAFKKPKKLLGD